MNCGSQFEKRKIQEEDESVDRKVMAKNNMAWVPDVMRNQELEKVQKRIVVMSEMNENE